MALKSVANLARNRILSSLTESRINFLLKQKFISSLVEKWNTDKSVPKTLKLIKSTTTPTNSGRELVVHNKQNELFNKEVATHIIRELAKFDPSPSFDYLLWICREYSGNHIRLFEDLGSRIHPALVKYNRMRLNGTLKANERDILQYTAFQVEDLTKEFVVIPDAKEIELKFYEDKQATLLYNDDQIKVVIPRTKAASIFFGVNTKWCVSASKSENHFEFYNKDGRLYFITIKRDNKRFAIHFNRNEFQNENEYAINEIRDINSNRIIKAQIKDIKHLTSNYPVLYKIFEPIAIKNLKTWFSLLFIKNPTEEMVLEAIKHNDVAYLTIDKPTEAMQLAAVKQDGYVIKYIIKAGIIPSEEMQLAAVTQDGDAIAYIIKAGIVPSEAVQLAAIKQSGQAISHIIKAGIIPSEEMQLTAVKQNGQAISYIINADIHPSEEMQLAAVTQYGYAIQYIIKAGIVPSEAVKLAAVKQDGYVIARIIQAGISPSKAVQLAAVTQHGYVIENIIKAGIVPSEEIQLAAVTQDGVAIKYIIEAGIVPSEAVQLAAVKQGGSTIVYIIKAGIVPSEAVQLAAVKRNRYVIKCIVKPTAKVLALQKKLWE